MDGEGSTCPKQRRSRPVTLESGNVSLKNVGSHDKRVKKVLAEQRCVTITALRGDTKTTNTPSEFSTVGHRDSGSAAAPGDH